MTEPRIHLTDEQARAIREAWPTAPNPDPLHVPEDKPYAPRGESEPTMVIAWMALAVLVALLAVAVGVVVTR